MTFVEMIQFWILGELMPFLIGIGFALIAINVYVISEVKKIFKRH